MGGPGSGNHWRPCKKETVEDCLSIDANRWTREGILKADVCLTGSWRWTYPNGDGFTVTYEANTLNASSPFVRLWYSWVWKSTGKEDTEKYWVHLTTTRPRFGGLRWWFVCPLVIKGRPCNRRVGKLYLPPHGRYFGCRHCYDLTYTSCQESHKLDTLYHHLARKTGYDFDTVREAMKTIANGR
jgi:hypothetical protein